MDRRVSRKKDNEAESDFEKEVKESPSISEAEEEHRIA